jgi:hypothetical protein
MISGVVAMSASEAHPGDGLQAVWPAPTVQDQDDVVRFWLGEQAMSEPEARARAPQLLVIARDEAGCVMGVSTAVATWVERLGIRCFYYRTFVGQAHRARGVARDILVASCNHLNQRFAQGIDPEVLGVFLDIENPALARVHNQAVWREGEFCFVFVGQTPSGHQLRVAYFDEAKIDGKQVEPAILDAVDGFALTDP